MGYLLHPSCGEVPDTTSPQPVNWDKPTAKQTRDEIVQSREATIHESFCQAQIWALIACLSLSNFSDTPEFAERINLLCKRWLGPKVDQTMFHSVFWNIAHQLLHCGLGPSLYKSKDPRQLSRRSAAIISDNEHIPESFLLGFKCNHPKLFEAIPNIRTWTDAKFAAAATGAWPAESTSWPLEDHICGTQQTYTLRRFGVRIGT